MIPVFEPIITREDAKSVEQALKSGEISGSFGRFIPEFEKMCADYHGVKYGISTTSGTTALHLAVAALGLKRGDEVIISTFTNVATCLAVTHNNLTPVAVDSEPETWNIDTSKIEKKITKKTRAIIPVHIYGHPVEMDPILKIAREYELVVIEDAAEAQGAEYKNKKVGCLGEMGCLSFYYNKSITTGEGGMVLTNNRKLRDKLALLKNLAFQKPRFLHNYAGFNFCLTNIQAALGVSQMKRIERIVERKRQIAQWYLEALGNVRGIQLPVEKPWAKSTYWMFGIVINPKEFSRGRDEVAEKLQAMGVETRPFFIPMNQQPVFLKMGFFKNDRCPVAENLGRNGLYLPSGYMLTKQQISSICKKLVSLKKNEK